MSLSPNTQLGRYEIRSQIGAGGMGEVYLALDATLNRTVALKILPSNAAFDAERMRRFVQEAKAAAALSHPNIAHIYEVGESEGTHFIAMEYVDGETLREKIHTEKTAINKLLIYLAQVAEGLAKAHAAGIVHRDLKPDNIMITPDGYAKILDFGLAKLIEPQTGFGSTSGSSEVATALLPQHSTPGMIMGTVGYMSPEQAQGRVKEIDHRSDIFSFGCILYEAATGRKAFEGKDVLDSLHKIVHAPTPQIKDVNSLAPDDLQRIVRRCLAKEPEKRYQSIKDVAIELDEIQHELKIFAEAERSSQPTGSGLATLEGSISAEVNSEHQSANNTAHQHLARPTSSAEYMMIEIKKHKSVSIVVLAVLLLAVGGLGFWYFSGPSNTSQIESLAVLPFVNENGNPDNDYLSDGMTESLISSLSQLPGLSVKARSSVFRFKGKDVSPQTVGNELSVQAVLLGRVIQRGDQLTLSLELVDARTENVIWSEQYNRKQTDLVSLQSEIARDVSQKLRTRLSGADERRVTKNYTEDTEAYRHYLKGRYQLNRRTEEGFRKGIAFFQQAIDEDPNYAPAYAGLADAYNQMGAWMTLPPSETFPKAKAAAERALQLDDTLAEAHTAAAFGKFYYDWDFAAAEREVQKAISHDPNYATARELYGYQMYLINPRRFDEAVRELNTAHDLDPLSLSVNFSIAALFYFERNYDEAIRRLEEIQRLDPTFTLGYGLLGVIYLEKGMNDESVAAALKGSSLEGGGLSKEQINILEKAYKESGIEGYLRKHAELLQEQGKKRYVSPVLIAMDYASLGEKDLALEWLEKAYRDRSSWLIEIGVDPIWEDLRSDPRYQDLVRRVGLPQ